MSNSEARNLIEYKDEKCCKPNLPFMEAEILNDPALHLLNYLVIMFNNQPLQLVLFVE